MSPLRHSHRGHHGPKLTVVVRPQGSGEVEAGRSLGGLGGTSVGAGPGGRTVGQARHVSRPPPAAVVGLHLPLGWGIGAQRDKGVNLPSPVEFYGSVTERRVYDRGGGGPDGADREGGRWFGRWWRLPPRCSGWSGTFVRPSPRDHPAYRRPPGQGRGRGDGPVSSPGWDVPDRSNHPEAFCRVTGAPTRVHPDSVGIPDRPGSEPGPTLRSQTGEAAQWTPWGHGRHPAVFGRDHTVRRLSPVPRVSPPGSRSELGV